MKNFTLMMLAGIILATISFAEDEQEKIYPFDLQIRVYPEKICYGDVCFFTFSVTNQWMEPLDLPYGRNFLRSMIGMYYHGEKNFLIYESTDPTEREFPIRPPLFPKRPVKPGETVEFHIRAAWFPFPGFAQSEQSKELLQLVNQGKNDYRVLFSFSYHRALYRTMSSGHIVDKPECVLRIQPRLQEEFKLLQEWFFELPSTQNDRGVSMDGVLAHPYHVRDSPYERRFIPNPTPLEIEESLAEYQKFSSSVETRTPEILARIERTNDLASQIIERSKHPDSTISQNMVEFIQLRGFLVDMRYAENERAEQAAFEKLMDFVDTAKDKELWVRFLDEIGLYSIMHQTHFPSRKVEQYRELFARRFNAK